MPHPIIDHLVGALTSFVHGVESVADSEIVQLATTFIPPLKAFALTVSVDAHMAEAALKAIPLVEAAIDELQKMGFKPADWDDPVRLSQDEMHRTEG